MFKRALIAVAVLGMVSAPAIADLAGTLDTLTVNNGLQRLHPNGGGTVGILTAGGGLYPNTAVTTMYSSPIVSNLMLYPNASDVITVTFALHWPYATPILVERMRNGIIWDTSEVALLGAGPAGQFVTNNIGTGAATGAAVLNSLVSPLSGTETVVGIEAFPAVGGTFILLGSEIMPFFKVTFHASAPFPADGIADLILPEAQQTTPTPGQGVGIIFRTFTSSFVHTAFSSFLTNINPGASLFINFGSSNPSAGLELKPEPASAALLGIGALALTGGFWRRRRRQA